MHCRILKRSDTVSVKYIDARMYMPEWGMLYTCICSSRSCIIKNICVTLSTVTSGLVMSLVYTQYHAGYYRRAITTSIYIYTDCFKH